jgi:hypothetical protein
MLWRSLVAGEGEVLRRFSATVPRLNGVATVTGPRLLVHPRYESAGWLMVQARAYWVGVR